MSSRTAAVRLRVFAVMLLFTVSASPLLAAERELLVRAIGQLPRKELVTYLAATAQPSNILPAEHPDYARLTFREIAFKLCGTVHDGYLEALAARNGGTNLNPDAVSGELAYRLNWPACFEVRLNVQHRVRRGEHPTGIRSDLTGEYAAGPELDAFFAPSGIDPRDRRLATGRLLTLPYATLKTKVRIPEQSAAEFIAAIRSAGGRRVQVEAARSRGALIGPAGGQTLASGGECTYETDPDYPFSALAVAAAFNRLETPKNNVYVAIFDNGFFGVPCTASGCPPPLASAAEYSSRFPRTFFAPPSFYQSYGANIGVNHVLGPLNYPQLKPDDVNEVSGHGTHVAGLVLGGPTFEPYRRHLTEGGQSWSRLLLSIVAVARGTLDLEPQTESRIGTALDAMVRPDIVNMSLAFDDTSTQAVFNKLLERSQTLFVAAAGNDASDLSERPLFPAALGGRGRANFITVASIDSTGRLSGFSNFGDAADIAAPGCKIVSWLNAEGEDIPLSGTSQAAPLVSFAAALLKSRLDPITPQALKNRLIVAGDLISDSESRSRIWSGTRLNIAKALLADQDYIAIRDGQKTVTYLGHVQRFTGVSCGPNPRGFDDLRALKRSSPSEFYVYTSSGSGPVSVCRGKLLERTAADPNVEVMLSFVPTERLEGASFIAVDPATPALEVKVADVMELVRRAP